MNTVEDQGEHERASAEEIIAASEPFPGVESVLVELSEDHVGDPSISLTFKIRDDLAIDEGWIREFNKYATKMTLKLIHSGLKRFPYTRLESAA